MNKKLFFFNYFVRSYFTFSYLPRGESSGAFEGVKTLRGRLLIIE
jgi:hypothetical protein